MNTTPPQSENARLGQAVAGLAATIAEVIEARIRQIEGVLEHKIAQRTIQPILDKRQAAEVFNVSVRTVDSWMSRGFLPYYKIGRSVRIPMADAEA